MLALGAKPGEAYRVFGWEFSSEAFPLFGEERYEEAYAILSRANAQHPDTPGVLYNLACAEARLGKNEEAVEHLRRAIELYDGFAAIARDDPDLAPIRDPDLLEGANTGSPAPPQPLARMSAQVTHLDELDRIGVGGHGLQWRPVRRKLGIESLGVNAWTAEEAGQEVVGAPRRDGSGAGKHEELYIVVRGRARFQLDDEEFDAPVGTCVFVRDRTVRRGAYAEEAGTTVLAVGGKPGEAFEVSPWESYFAAIPLSAAGDHKGAAAIIREELERSPDNASVLYNLACAESLGGDTESALEHLARAVELNPKTAEWAREDTDFDAIRGDPRFA